MRKSWQKWRSFSVRLVFLNSAVLLVAALSACAGSGAKYTRSLHTLDNEAALKKVAHELDRRMITFRTIKFAGSLSGSWIGREGSFQMVGALRWPSDIRVDLLDPAIGTVASLAVSDGEMTWHLPQENRVYRGEASARTLGRATGFAWSAAEVCGLLAGLPPMEYGDRFVDWWMGPEGLAVSPDEHAVLSLGDGNRLPEKYVRFREPERKHIEAQIHFEDYRPLKGFLFPYSIDIEMLGFPRATMKLVYDDLETNVVLLPDVFQLNVPEGTKLVQMK